MSEKIKFRCPKCGKKFRVASSFIGRRVSCAQCGNVFRLRDDDPFLENTHQEENIDVVIPELVSEPVVVEAEYVSPIPVIPVSQKKRADSPQGQSDFQKKLKQKRGEPTDRLTRKEKLALAKTQQRDRVEFDWQYGSWGIALIILGFVSIAMPEADSVRGGRGVIKLLGRALFSLGPFAPILGLLLGLGGVALVVNSTRNFPKIVVGLGVGLVSSALVVGCLLSFLVAMDKMTDTGSKPLTQAQRNAKRKQQEELAEQHLAKLEENRRETIGRTQRDSSRPTNIRDNFPTPRSFQAGRPDRDNDPEFDDGQNEDHDADSIFSNRRPRLDPFTDARSRVTPIRGNMPTSVDSFRARADFKIKEARDGMSLERFRRMKGLELFDSGDSQGQASGNGRVYFERNQELQGIAFYDQDETMLVPIQSGDSAMQGMSHCKSGEHLRGFNLNFVNEELRGIQCIYAQSLEPGNHEQRFGKWLGVEPDNGNGSKITSNGKAIHGLFIFKQRRSVVGVQLIIKR